MLTRFDDVYGVLRQHDRYSNVPLGILEGNLARTSDIRMADPPVHTLPQLPQSAALSLPLHSLSGQTGPDGQVELHWPLLQACPVAHLLPQEPQFWALFGTQEPPQRM